MSDTAGTDRRGLFQTPLACGMILGALAAGCELGVRQGLLSFERFSFSGVSFVSHWIYFAILLSAAALYRRSWMLVRNAFLWALCMMAGMALLGSALYRLFYAMTVSLIAKVAVMYLPLLFLVAGCGWAAASLYGCSRRRWRFVIASLSVAAVGLVIATVLLNLNRDAVLADKEFDILRVVFNLVGTMVLGMAQAWPVEKLEREV